MKAKENWNKHTNRYINDKYNGCDSFLLLFINENWKESFITTGKKAIAKDRRR